MALREALVRADANVPQYRKNLAESLLRFGQARQAAGDLVGASADWKRAVAFFKTVSDLDGEYIYYYAGCHALLSSIAGLAGTGVAAVERETHAKRAMALLHHAAGMGYRNAGAYRTRRRWTRFGAGRISGFCCSTWLSPGTRWRGRR